MIRRLFSSRDIKGDLLEWLAAAIGVLGILVAVSLVEEVYPPDFPETDAVLLSRLSDR